MQSLIIANREDVLSLRELIRVAPVKRTVHQYRRWIVQGLKTPSGKTFHLEHVRIGRAFATSLPAVQRFLQQLQD